MRLPLHVKNVNTVNLKDYLGFDLQADGTCKFTPETFEPCCVSQDENGDCQVCNKGLHLNQEGVCEENDIPGCL